MIEKADLVMVAYEAIDNKNDVDVSLEDFAKVAVDAIIAELAPAITDETSGLHIIDTGGAWNEHTGEILLNEDEWNSIVHARDSLDKLLGSLK